MAVTSTRRPRHVAKHLPPIQPHRRRRRKRGLIAAAVVIALVAAGVTAVLWFPRPKHAALASQNAKTSGHASPSPTPAPFDPNVGAILPTDRVVAYYAVPGAPATGPAWQLSTSMLDRLQAQGEVYQKLDPAHPVKLGIDLVVSVPDRFKGSSGTYSHHVSAATIEQYVEFCEKHNLLLFLDLDIGWADPLTELEFFTPYLKLPFVEVAIDPEWMFPRHNGIPGKNLSNVRASDLNPLIEAVAEMPMKYHVPRKIMIIHQYRGDGDGKADPFNAKSSEIADKRNIVNDPRVDLVIHIDSVGGWPGDIAAKEDQYHRWVAEDMVKYQNFQYGGFKIFYQIESRNKLMTPAQVMSMSPAPMVVTYGN
ncbi:MAG TPA: hypothetical protein VFR11_16640 [Micromonosporaceae bacterium]|jgi:hypothetical protein|nr:hypothetical protein [Micromonosporaceae bacterium]